MTDLHARRVDLICQYWNGVQPLRQANEIEPGFMKRLSNVWRLSLLRAQRFEHAGLLEVRNTSSSGRARYVVPTDIGRAYVVLCREAARAANLSWPESPYGDGMGLGGYNNWQAEWVERRDRFRQALLALAPPDLDATVI